MGTAKKIQSVLDQKLKKVREAPEGFIFFVSLHNFVEYIESMPSFAVFFDGRKKGTRAAEIPARYAILKQIYQGIEDIDLRTTEDLGHDRYAAVRELSMIRGKDVSESNSLWKKREFLRKLTGEIHKTLQVHLSELESKK